MRILHTADWHLADRLGRRDRTADLRLGVERVADYCTREKIDLLLVAGDLFSELAGPEALREAIRHLQEVFARLVQRSSEFNHASKFSTWLYAIARNQCIDHMRRMKHRRHASLDGTSTRQDGDSAGAAWVERLAREVVERVGEQGEHEDADPIVMQRVVIAEPGNGAIGGRLVEFDGDPEQADDAACCY